MPSAACNAALKWTLLLDGLVFSAVAVAIGIWPNETWSYFLSEPLKHEGSSSTTSESGETVNGADPRGAALFLASGTLAAVTAAIVILLLAAAGAAASGSRSADTRGRQGHKRSNGGNDHRDVIKSSSNADRASAAVAGITVARVGAAAVAMLVAMVVFLDVVALERPGLAITPIYYQLAAAFSLLILNLGALLASFSNEVVLPNAARKNRGSPPVPVPMGAAVGADSGDAASANNLQEPLLRTSGTGTEGVHAASVASGEAAVLTAASKADAKTEKEAAAAAETSKGWSALFSIAAPQKGWLLTASAVLLVRLPFSLAGPHFVSSVLGAVIDGDAKQAHYFALCLIAVGTVDALLDFWTFFLYGFAQQKLIAKLRTDVFAAVLKQDMGFFDVSSTGDLTSRLTSDTAEMSADLTWVFRFTIEALVRIGGIAAYMVWSEWRLAMVAFAVVPICVLAGKVYGDWLHKNAKQVQTAQADANAAATETLGNARTVAICGTARAEKWRHSMAVHLSYVLNVRQTAMQAGYFMLINTFLINTVLQASLLLYGSYLCINHGMHPQVLIAFMLYQGQLQEYTANLVNSLTNLVKSTGAGAKVFALLARSPRKRPHLGFHPRDHGPNPSGDGGGSGGGTRRSNGKASSSRQRQQQQSPLLAAATVGSKDEWSILEEAYDEDDAYANDGGSDNDSSGDDSSSSDDEGGDTGNNSNSHLQNHANSASLLPADSSHGNSGDNINSSSSSNNNIPSLSLSLPVDSTLPLSLPPVATNAAGGAMSLSLNNVWFAYPSRPREPVLRGLTISAQPGQTAALVGSSGSGKSTVLHLLTRLYEPATGNVMVNGLDVAAYQPSWLKRRTAVVAQEPVLFAGTIRDNILYARSRSRRSLNQAQGTSNEHGGNSQGNNNSSSSSSNSRRSSNNCLRLPEHSTTPLSTKKQEKLHVEAVKAAKKAHAADFIESLPMGYDSQVGERGVQLSGGQKQRIAIARAVCSNPTLLLLDEATSALDAKAEVEVQAALASASQGCTTVVVAHRLATIQGADKIIVMRDGVAVEEGKHEELLQRPNGAYRALVKLQQQQV